MDLIQNWDISILLYLQEHLRSDVFTFFWRTVTFLGDAGWFWIVSACALLLSKKTRKTGLCALLALGINAVFTNLLLKNIFARIRPYDVEHALILLVNKPRDFSFPSGHTSASFACALVYLKSFPRRYGIPAVILASLIAFSRLYVAVHYPTDVLAGILVGIVSSMLALCIMKTLSQKYAFLSESGKF